VSPTSSEGTRFRRVFTVTVIALAGLCAVFLALGYLQGPKLSSALVDTRGVIEQDGQQLRLFANQQLAAVTAEQVTISPPTPFTVSSSADLVAVQFEERLRYSTEYRVTVTGVHSTALPQESTLEYRFTTGAPELYYLDRGEPDDEVVLTGLSGSEREVAYTARRIQDFVVMDDSLAVVRLTDLGTSEIDIVTISTGFVERLPLPAEGLVEHVDAADTGRLLGFTFATGTSTTLYTIDLDAGRDFVAAPDLDGSPLFPLGWQFVPGTTTLAALGTSQTLLLIDPATGELTPLGQFQEFDRVSADGRIATLSDPGGAIAVTLADGGQQPLSASPVDGQPAFLGAVDVLPNGDRVEKVVVADPSGTAFSSLLVYDDGETSRVLYAADGGSITDFTVSPNGQYVAIETIPDLSVSVSDDYDHDARSTSVTTVIVPVDGGMSVRSMTGFRLHW
jgi:hypothetical protein